MSSVLEYKECSCGNKEMSSDYHYKTDELYEFCDVCGYFHSITIKNKIEDGNYPDDWKPEYDEQKGKTGYVIKIFEKDLVGHLVTCVDKSNLKKMLNDLRNDKFVTKFCITFKPENGYYQTQIFDKNKNNKKFEISYIIDVESDNPDDYTVNEVILAKNNIDAIKKLAIQNVDEKFTDIIEWIKNIDGDFDNVINTLKGWGFVITNVKEIE